MSQRSPRGEAHAIIAAFLREIGHQFPSVGAPDLVARLARAGVIGGGDKYTAQVLAEQARDEAQARINKALTLLDKMSVLDVKFEKRDEVRAVLTGEPKWSKDHTPVVHRNCDRIYCPFCDGGLSACSVCGSFEGATTTHCPGEDMYSKYGDQVYAGEIDFRDGEWRKGECSRHTPAYWRTPAGLAEIEKARAGG